MPSDSELIAETARAAAGAKGAADAVGTRVVALAGVVEVLRGQLAAIRQEIADLRQATVLVATDMDHPSGATYLVQGLGASKTWISDGQQWADLVNGFPGLKPALWKGETLSKIPTNGEDPDPPSKPST